MNNISGREFNPLQLGGYGYSICLGAVCICYSYILCMIRCRETQLARVVLANKLDNIVGKTLRLAAPPLLIYGHLQTLNRHLYFILDTQELFAFNFI